MLEEQKKYRDLNGVRNWLKNSTRPHYQEVDNHESPVKENWSRWQFLCFRDDLVTRQWSPRETVMYQRVILEHNFQTDLKNFTVAAPNDIMAARFNQDSSAVLAHC